MKVNYEARILLSDMVSKYCAHCGAPAVETEACDRCGQPVCESKACAKECGAYLDDARQAMSRTRSWLAGIFLPSDLAIRLQEVRIVAEAGMPGYMSITERNVTTMTHCESCYVIGMLEPYRGRSRCQTCGNVAPTEDQVRN